MLTAGVLLSQLVQAGSAPVPPPRFQGPDAIERPLDLRLAGQDPQAVLAGAPGDWCPAGEDFLAWQAQRERQTLAEARLRKSHGGLPDITLRNGVVIMEDDGRLMRFDRRPDLEGLSLDFLPVPGVGYRVLRGPSMYDTNIGAQVITNQRGYAEAAVDLTLLTFPFGGTPRSRIWLTTTIAASFVDPAPPGPAQLHMGDVLGDRTPRVAPLQSGTSVYGWNVFFREAIDRAVITWQAVDGGWLDLSVQAVLFSDGRIRFNYRSTRGVQHGSAVVVDGDPAWWNDRLAGGLMTDPAGNVGVPPPDGPALDIVEIRGFQVADSELMEIEVQMASPLPAATDGELEFALELRDEAGDPVFTTIWFAWNDGAQVWGSAAEIVFDTLRFRVLRSEMPLADDDFNVVVWTAQNWSWQQAIGADLAFIVPPVPVMRDFSAAPFPALRGPLMESFTLPDLNVYAVYDAFSRHFASPRIDGLAIFQNFETDIVFYAGAYSTVGNAGADGIGRGNSTDPESPALLHMNKLLYGWNSWDEGKTLVLNHEFGHHWLYFPSVMEGGVSGKPLGEGHPAGWVHTPAAAPVFRSDDSSCMGGSTWTDNMDGTFRSAPAMVNHGYSWHELYFMGLADASEAEDFYYIANSNPPLPGAYWPPNDSLVTGNRVDVTVQQFIDAMGPRVPAQSPRTDFLVPMVLVVRPGEWSQADVDETARECDVWAPGFNLATAGRATVTCDRVGMRPPEATIVDPPGSITVNVGDPVTFSGVGTDPDEDFVALTWNFDGAAPDAFREGPHVVAFAAAGAYFVTLSARDATGMVDPTPDMRIVTVTCRDPDVVTDLRVAHDRDLTLALAWAGPMPAPDEHAIFSTTDLRTLPMTESAIAISGSAQPMRVEPVVFFKVAARNLPDCLGPLDP